MSERKRFDEMAPKERELCEALVRSKAPITINESERYLWFLGRRYRLTTHQYLVIYRLYDKWMAHPEGYPESEFKARHERHHSKKSPTTYADSQGYWLLPENSKVKDSFRRSPLWGYLVIRGEDRRLKLNLPLPQTPDAPEIWLGPPNLEALMLGKKTTQRFGNHAKKKPTARRRSSKR